MEIRNILPQWDISVEVLATDAEGMIREAREYLQRDKNFTIKIPMIAEWLKAVTQLSKEWIKTNVTLIFSAVQAMMAAKAGATYVSPFVGRLDDIWSDGLVLIEEIRNVFDNYSFDTKILAASIRHMEHIRQCMLIWADICTIPSKLIHQMIQHPLTSKWLEQFLKDANA